MKINYKPIYSGHFLQKPQMSVIDRFDCIRFAFDLWIFFSLHYADILFLLVQYLKSHGSIKGFQLFQDSIIVKN